MRGYERIIEFLSTALLIIVGVLGILVTALDFIGTDFNNGPWKWIKGPLPITLLIVALLALALGLERLIRFQQMNRQLDSIEKLVETSPERIIRSLHGVDVKGFDDAHQFYTYVAKRIREAKKSVDDMSLGESELELTVAGQEAKAKYIEAIYTSCASKKTLTYRELASFPSNAHFARAEAILNKNLLNYVLGYCRYSYKDSLPILQFMVVDSEEVIFGFYQVPKDMQATKPIQLSVKHHDIVALFQDYYNTIWKTSKVVRDMQTLRRIQQEGA